MALFHSKEPHQPQQHTGETGLHFRAETDQTRPPKWTAPQAELDHLHQIRHTFLPDWLLERRSRAERALSTVIATCYLKGVSTRRMNDLVATLGISNLSKSQVSRMSEELDEMVADF